MHRRQLNFARLLFSMRPRGGMLIKAGRESLDPTRPSMEFVRTHHAKFGETIYIPGSSLKGAMRSHAERVFRGLRFENICDPFDEASRCRKLEEDESTLGREPTAQTLYQSQCSVCRTFGSTSVRGRCALSDGYPWDPRASEEDQVDALREANRTENRWHVGIDRKTGHAHTGALYDAELAVNGRFFTEIKLVNFQLWQLGLVGAILKEIDAGYVPIGFGKSRGLGQVATVLESLHIESADCVEGHLLGAGFLASVDEQQSYRLTPDDFLELPALPESGFDLESSWRGHEMRLDQGASALLIDALVRGPLKSFVESHRQPRPSGGAL